MKIDNTSVPAAQRQQEVKSRPQPENSPAGSDVPAHGDSVQMSGVAKLAAKLGELSDDRIAELRSQFRQGAYQPDSEKVSQKLIDSMGS